jgi:hypothetical protein
MSEAAASARSAGAFVVFLDVAPGHWELVGEVGRRPGLTAREARQQAVSDATGGTARPDETYAAVPRSEWHVARQL